MRNGGGTRGIARTLVLTVALALVGACSGSDDGLVSAQLTTSFTVPAQAAMSVPDPTVASQDIGPPTTDGQSATDATPSGDGASPITGVVDPASGAAAAAPAATKGATPAGGATTGATTGPAGGGATSGGTTGATSGGGATTGGTPATGAGNSSGGAAVPGEAAAVDTSHPTRTVGTGTPASCTSAAVVAAVAAGGIITFNCGPDPVTITLAATAKVVNANGPDVVLDGGGKVTLSGGGQRRILYMNTCDQAQGWTTAHCNNQDSPRLTVQNLTLADGNATGQTTDGGGGGAVFVRGGRLKVVGSRFVRNRCDTTGPDLGGAAIRVLDQYQGLPVYVVASTFGGASGQGGICSNGGALSSIGVSWVVLNSVLSFNQAVGNGANPARGGTPGGGSGGAIYTDGNRFTVTLSGTRIEDNQAREGGGAVFFVSNDRTGTMRIEGSTLRRNPSAGFETAGFPGIFFLGQSPPQVSSSTLQ